MRITNSRDGVKRMTIQIQQRLGRSELVDEMCLWLCLQYSNTGDVDVDDPDTWPKRLGRARILNEVRDQLAFHGYDARNWWSDRAGEGQTDDIQDWAERIVDRAFPEFQEDR